MSSSSPATSKAKIAIVGGTGYGGAELIRLLIAHPGVELARVTSIDHVGEPLEAVHKNLTRTGLRFQEMSATAAAEGMDVVFLALPHKVSAKLGAELDALDVRVIDLSGDFRLRSASAYATYYGGAHPHPELLGRWTYGLPELDRDAIAAARRVASPGCFATTIALGLLPLARRGLLSGVVRTVAATGSSGSGAYAQEGTHHPLRANNLKAYKILEHQHRPEIEQTLRDAGAAADLALHFVPVSAPLSRGILATSFVTLDAAWSRDRVHALMREFYADSAFVRVAEPPRTAEVVAVKGSMWVDLGVEVSEPCTEAGGPPQVSCVVSTALDNLVKGGAGQAVQSMNLMLGLDERAGIGAPALWP